jgi:hypothetical protein
MMVFITFEQQSFIVYSLYNRSETENYAFGPQGLCAPFNPLTQNDI